MAEQVNSVTQRVEKALDTVRPFLHADGGDVELVEVSDDMVVAIRLLGSCESCEISDMTMKLGIEEGIRNEVPEVKDVVAINQQQQTHQ